MIAYQFFAACDCGDVANTWIFT